MAKTIIVSRRIKERRKKPAVMEVTSPKRAQLKNTNSAVKDKNTDKQMTQVTILV